MNEKIFVVTCKATYYEGQPTFHVVDVFRKREDAEACQDEHEKISHCDYTVIEECEVK